MDEVRQTPSRASASPRCKAPPRSRRHSRVSERSLTVVVDASAVVDAATGVSLRSWPSLVAVLRQRGRPLVAPELMWSEAYSVLHERQWRGVMRPEEALEARHHITIAEIEPRRPAGLRARAWEIADRMGWAKTYDAEYCALAELLGCEVITGDRRLRAAARGRLDYVLTVAEATERIASG